MSSSTATHGGPAAAPGTSLAPSASGPAKPARRGGADRERRRTALWMLAPSVIHLAWWIGIPVVVTFGLAFTRYDVLAGTASFAGLDNFRQIFSDPTWNASIWHTVVFTFFNVPVAMAVALLLAIALNTNLRGRTWYRAAVFLPHITATVAIALVWMWMFEPRIGLINTALDRVGVKGPVWLADPSYAMAAVIAVSVWKGIGIKMLIYLAALQALPQDVYEAAELDGASRLRRLWSITLPLLKPATFFVLVVSVIDSFQAFDQMYILTPDGGPDNATTVMTQQIYQTAFQQFRMGPAAAQSVVLFAFLVVLMAMSRRLTGKDDHVR